MNTTGGGLRGWEVAPTLFLAGIGMGLVTPVLMGVIVSGVPTQDAGSASGVLTSVIQLGASMGIAVAGIVFFALLQSASGLDEPASAVAAALARAAPSRGLHRGAGSHAVVPRRRLLADLPALALPAEHSQEQPSTAAHGSIGHPTTRKERKAPRLTSTGRAGPSAYPCIATGQPCRKIACPSSKRPRCPSRDRPLSALRVGSAVLGRNALVTGASGGVGQFAVQPAMASGADVVVIMG